MKVYDNFNLTEYNSYRIKSKCKKTYFPENEDDIIKLFSLKQDYILLGSGHNLILSKAYYDTDFIIFNGNFDSIEVEIDSNVIVAESGATILTVSETAEKNSLTGAEFLFDIPSSVGGAVVMNAGTKEGETKNILKKVRYLDLKDMTVNEKSNEDLELEYRTSFFQKNKNTIILKAWFKLSKGDPSEIRRIMNESKTRRWSKQPRDYPNSGSVFKRPPGKFVGPMIEELGLKGFSIGGAQVSKKHSGFIVNKGNATGTDILELIQYIQDKVKKRHNINLEVEQRII
tara:strand:- start:416 stop:1273 length:858 start_codon:yes stop_codon:yes gene_type:complete